ncbi:hypothetical protein GCM10020221_29600 [Streptomyces thioluteus]|uniref:Uncharacterized protein n=1 Tax=Streptomyces thioluteus TaxID=66431 RepID=A0ABP6JFP2_STRTU
MSRRGRLNRSFPNRFPEIDFGSIPGAGTAGGASLKVEPAIKWQVADSGRTGSCDGFPSLILLVRVGRHRNRRITSSTACTKIAQRARFRYERTWGHLMSGSLSFA